MFVIRRDDGLYVAKTGSDYVYTKRLENAKVFSTREEADKNRCIDNEMVVDVHDLLRIE